jgi:hypothetical protein
MAWVKLDESLEEHTIPAGNGDHENPMVSSSARCGADKCTPQTYKMVAYGEL